MRAVKGSRGRGGVERLENDRKQNRWEANKTFGGNYEAYFAFVLCVLCSDSLCVLGDSCTDATQGSGPDVAQ